MIFDNGHIKEIKQYSYELEFSDEDGLIEFSNKIHSLLDKLVQNDDYIYSTFLVVKNNIIIPHKFKFGTIIKDKKYKMYVSEIQNSLSRKLRESNSTIGISNLLIDSKKNGLVLFSDEEKNNTKASIANVIDSYNLGEVKLTKENKKSIINLDEKVFKKEFYSGFIEDDEYSFKKVCKRLKIEDKNLLKPILSLYALSNPFIENKEKPFYSYFIRPNTSHDFYNGLFNFATTKPITSIELALLNLILFYVFSDIALKEKTNEIEKEANEKYHIELAHTINGNLGQALNYLKEDNIGNVHKNSINKAHKLIKRTKKRSDAFLKLHKKQRELNAGINSLEYIEFSKIDIKNITEDSLMNNIKNNNKEDIKKILSKNKYRYLQNPQIKFKVEESLEVLLYNVIHNAVKYSKNINDLEIKIENYDSKLEIKIINDIPMEKDFIEDINNNFTNVNNAGFGFETISKILNIVPEFFIEALLIDDETKTSVNVIVMKK